ncbi:hypothetical protein BMI86_10310 [Thioclava sp. DLFJ5-1]|uniref:hypothetical protein n=1 Tax=Thioclava sp. DLFJ5-1 TaxID=1915314 RepID=UPI0009987AFB|nr:hypothetical protein [Thioclava sp. DLFJ5-1]OOY20889.1 hypothetical protein BMI86_10310 [Thioclava sp. DLFJ5-1]
MSKIQFVTDNQDANLQAALALTGSQGFMEDARAVAAYEPGEEGQPDQIVGAFVYECFRGNRAEVHFGMANGRPLTMELVQTVSLLAFHPKAFDLDQLLFRVHPGNVKAICALLKIGCEFEYRDRGSLVGGHDGIVLSLYRANVAPAGPPSNDTPDNGH